MPKRDPESEPAVEEPVEESAPTAGQRLRAAREEKGLSLEDVAAQTRIPQRHLESIETAEWDKLPAPTYTIGFAKSYASIVGLDRTDIGDQLREEMGGQRFAASQSEVIEAADPARTMPRWLVISAVIAVVVLVIGMSVLNRRSLEQPAEVSSNEPAAPEAAPAVAPPQPQAAAPNPAATAQGPVVLTATAPAWLRVTDQGTKLYEGVLQPGQTYSVPPMATAPMLRVGAPEAVRITVGNAVAPQVGPSGQVTSNVSLKPADLMKGGAPAAGQ
ncbi:MAG TPA: helix-turn-helix domain-containing protein [Sphingomicrobium sp.]|jgi:cytoskeletal protein RodZ